MVLPLSLAMTATELATAPKCPCAYMACHFSSEDAGLFGCPDTLPPDSILIIDDSIPPENHDISKIVKQLQEFAESLQIKGILLDFQKPDIEASRRFIYALLESVPCPVTVSAEYARDLSCSVFLPPPPLYRPLKDYLKPWDNREIWLDAALSCGKFLITPQGSEFLDDAVPPSRESFFEDNTLHCCYQIQHSGEQAEVYLWRTPEQLKTLLDEAANLGVSQAVGLYQELGKYFPIKNSEEM